MAGIAVKDLYWAAGFLEGEGSFSLQSQQTRGKGIEVVRATQQHKPPLDLLQAILGGTISGPYPPQARSRLPYYVWSVSGERARGVMLTLYALLSPRRQEQILATRKEN